MENGKEITHFTKKIGQTIVKSFTRPTQTEIGDIKARLRVLGVLANNVVDVSINPRTNQIELITVGIDNKIKLDKGMTVNKYVDFWLFQYKKRGEKGRAVKATSFNDYVCKAQIIKQTLGKFVSTNGREVEIKMADLNYNFINEQLQKLHSTVSHNTAIQVRNHVFNLMAHARKDKIINENPLEGEKINFPTPTEKFVRKIISEEDIGKVVQYCIKNWYIDVLTQLFTRSKDFRN